MSSLFLVALLREHMFVVKTMFKITKSFKFSISPSILKIQRRQTTFSKARKMFSLYFDTLFVIGQPAEIEDDFQVVS